MIPMRIKRLGCPQRGWGVLLKQSTDLLSSSIWALGEESPENCSRSWCGKKGVTGSIPLDSNREVSVRKRLKLTPDARGNRPQSKGTKGRFAPSSYGSGSPRGAMNSRSAAGRAAQA